MKSNFLIKALPLLSTLSLILFICINNQKQYTKLKLIIWDTPRLSLGNYIAISSTSGFIISYFTLFNIARNRQPRLRRVVDYTSQSEDDNYETNSTDKNYVSYENTLIERDIKDPSPTIKANFRVIGNISKSYNNSSQQYYNDIDNQVNDNNQESSYSYRNIDEDEQTNIDITSDWDDNSYNNW